MYIHRYYMIFSSLHPPRLPAPKPHIFPQKVGKGQPHHIRGGGRPPALGTQPTRKIGKTNDKSRIKPR